MCGNLPLDPLILDLATIPRDHTCSSVDLTLTELRFHLPISESSRPFGLVFEFQVLRDKPKGENVELAVTVSNFLFAMLIFLSLCIFNSLTCLFNFLDEFFCFVSADMGLRWINKKGSLDQRDFDMSTIVSQFLLPL
ncbi:hypothetical protein COLO4_24589 [Corchorus olitorius]|uniref:Uncharacterized protein n=1 Tax=Corchorus olitorius TaxID=93759 RepID=A0A1R3I8Y7_9ROSI|nr:hypothetical protein COLO4_24589 [Corchorus olitorius]